MKIGILGGSFDPAHKGHLAISKEAKRRFKLEKIIWAVLAPQFVRHRSSNHPRPEPMCKQ